MNIFLGRLRNFTDGHIVHTINRQEVPVRIAVNLFILWGIVFNTGCQANPVEASILLESTSGPVGDSVTGSVPVSPTEENAPMIASPSMPADAGLQNLIDKAMTDLAQRLSIPTTQITLIEAMPVVWPDTSLGCPQSSMAYHEVLTPGYLIQLQADNRVYQYHSDADQLVVFCEEYPIEYPVKPGNIKDDKPWMPP